MKDDAMALADRLKGATTDAHRQAEGRDMQRRLVRGELDEPRLAAYLAQLSFVHAHLEKHLDATDATLSAPRLEVFNRGHLEARSTSTRLAWFIEARKTALRQYVWIDADQQPAAVRHRFGNLLVGEGRASAAHVEPSRVFIDVPAHARFIVIVGRIIS